MARGDKSKYTDKQKRKAEHIEEGYEKRGLSEEESERRAWATVNATHGGGEKPGGGGYGKPENKGPARSGGKKGGKKAAKKSGGTKKSSSKKSSSKKSSSKKGAAKKGAARKGRSRR
jgi:plasmid stabilization system protein ParE